MMAMSVNPINEGSLSYVMGQCDPAAFASGRHFSASLGLVPRQDGTGGKVKLGPISKRGNGYLRRLLVNGAMAVLCSKQAKADPWLVKLLETKERKVAACALANKMARIGWAVMVRQEDFRSRRHDQPCADLNQLGAVLTAVKTASRAPSAVAFGQS